VVAAAMLGACTGFLWWNANPAQIFMGDTGSLAIGAALACLALTTNTQLLLPIIGGLFVLETLSVILQVGASASSGAHLPDGPHPPPLRARRLARDHRHHPVLDPGRPGTALALGLFYADFIGTGGLD
jgi:phospho-N-acetylmuramoyl-pentapeptide-transferase